MKDLPDYAHGGYDVFSDYFASKDCSSVHWHDDETTCAAQRKGILVLHVQNTLFKVQAAVLEEYSSLLRELLRSLRSNPECARDDEEGCETLWWPEARALGVAELLTRIHDTK